jgi:hypothetical protein
MIFTRFNISNPNYTVRSKNREFLNVRDSEHHDVTVKILGGDFKSQKYMVRNI